MSSGLKSVEIKISLNKIKYVRMATITTVENIVLAMGIFLKAMTVFMQSTI